MPRKRFRLPDFAFFAHHGFSWFSSSLCFPWFLWKSSNQPPCLWLSELSSSFSWFPSFSWKAPNFGSKQKGPAEQVAPRVSSLATSLAFYRSQKGLSLKNSEKSPKRGSRGLSAPGSKKPEKESKMTIFQVFFRVFGPFSTFFRLFLSFFNPGAERPGNPFSDFFRSFLGRGLFDSCRRPNIGFLDGGNNALVIGL